MDWLEMAKEIVMTQAPDPKANEAIAVWGEARGLEDDEIGRLQRMDPYSQAAAVEVLGAEVVTEFENTYECPCGATWHDFWCAACDDDCPECGTTCSPSDSEVASVTIVDRGERCGVCGGKH